MIGPFLADEGRASCEEVVDPLQEKEETVYVVPGSDAEEHVARRFPHKTIKRVGNGLRPRVDPARSCRGLPHVFQRGKSAGLNAVYHFTFTGEEPRRATVVIRDKAIRVAEGHVGQADLRSPPTAGPGSASCGRKRTSSGRS